MAEVLGCMQKILRPIFSMSRKDWKWFLTENSGELSICIDQTLSRYFAYCGSHHALPLDMLDRAGGHYWPKY